MGTYHSTSRALCAVHAVKQKKVEKKKVPGVKNNLENPMDRGVQYSWASLVQMIKNPPAMWETWVRSLGWEDVRLFATL